MHRGFILTLAFAIILAFALLYPAGCGSMTATREPDDAAGEERAGSSDFLSGREAPVYSYEAIRTHAHDSGDFTQGLDLEGGILYEGTGLQGRSRLLKTDMRAGEVLQVMELAPEYFGEGVTVLGDEVFQLTYTSNLGFVYDRETLELKRTFTYPTEGWGLTHDGESLIMSDGTATLYFLDPASGTETGRLSVSDNLGPVANLNELEYVDGEVYANVWYTDVIAIISARSGEVTGWIDLTGLNPVPSRRREGHVLNGIAYDDETGHLLVTGKCWPHIYEIRVAHP